jgi:hypothetical protein
MISRTGLREGQKEISVVPETVSQVSAALRGNNEKNIES